MKFYVLFPQEQLTNAYTTFAYVSQPAKVAPAGEAWLAYSNRNALFAGDGSHATSMGTYLTAVGRLHIENTIKLIHCKVHHAGVHLA